AAVVAVAAGAVDVAVGVPPAVLLDELQPATTSVTSARLHITLMMPRRLRRRGAFMALLLFWLLVAYSRPYEAEARRGGA
ncbi:MAG: hypothetical protein ACXWPI_18140, partial [Ktedonobacterales bacterium]